MPPKKRSKSINIREIIAIIAILGGIIFSYPTIHPVTQGEADTGAPLKLINDNQSYIQLKNSGTVSVIISVNFSSDGSIRFKTDTGQIKNSIEVTYSVEPNNVATFRFTPIINSSLRNVTLFIKYRSNIEKLPGLKPQYSKSSWLAVYEKMIDIYGAETWKLRRFENLPIT